MLEARDGNLASGVPESHVPYSTCSCNLATRQRGPPTWATLAAAAFITDAFGPHSARALLASKHAKLRGIHLPRSSHARLTLLGGVGWACFQGSVFAFEQGSWLFRPVLAHGHATGKALSTPHAHTFSGCPVSPAVGSC